jgi:hypothetical protein
MCVCGQNMGASSCSALQMRAEKHFRGLEAAHFRPQDGWFNWICSSSGLVARSQRSNTSGVGVPRPPPAWLSQVAKLKPVMPGPLPRVPPFRQHTWITAESARDMLPAATLRSIEMAGQQTSAASSRVQMGLAVASCRGSEDMASRISRLPAEWREQCIDLLENAEVDQTRDDDGDYCTVC